MPKTESLLQELVDLQKKEMKRTRMNRFLKFIFGTLPAFVLIMLSIWSGYLLFQDTHNLLNDLPGTFDGILSGQQEDFFENIQGQLQQ